MNSHDPESSQSPSAPGQLATLFISTTNRCNLSCRYCSAGASPETSLRLDPQVAETALAEWIAASDLDRLTLILTGGEPLLWGYENLRRVCRTARNLASRHKIELAVGIQSNGALVDERFHRFCREHLVEPCFSLDGPPHISNLYRGDGERVLATLKRLQRDGIDFGIVCCLTDGVAENIGDVLAWFQQQRFLKIRINSIGAAPPERSSEALSSGKRFHVKRSIYEHIAKHGKSSLRERNVLRQVLAFEAWWQGGTIAKEHCELARCGAGVHLACLNPDGSYALCVEKSMTDGLGRTASLADLEMEANRFWESPGSWDRCIDCVASAICDHGCVAYHKMQFPQFEAECEANREFFKYLIQVHQRDSWGKSFS